MSRLGRLVRHELRVARQQFTRRIHNTTVRTLPALPQEISGIYDGLSLSTDYYIIITSYDIRRRCRDWTETSLYGCTGYYSSGVLCEERRRRRRWRSEIILLMLITGSSSTGCHVTISHIALWKPSFSYSCLWLGDR